MKSSKAWLWIRTLTMWAKINLIRPLKSVLPADEHQFPSVNALSLTAFFEVARQKGTLLKKWSSPTAAVDDQVFFGVSIPKAGWLGREENGKPGQDITYQKRQLSQPPTTGRCKHKLTLTAKQLFGHQRDLFHWPTVKIEAENRFRRG